MTGTPLDFHEIEKLKILRANGLTFHAISLKIDRDPKTIKKACLDPTIASDIAEMQEELADAYEGSLVTKDDRKHYRRGYTST